MRERGEGGAAARRGHIPAAWTPATAATLAKHSSSAAAVACPARAPLLSVLVANHAHPQQTGATQHTLWVQRGIHRLRITTATAAVMRRGRVRLRARAGDGSQAPPAPTSDTAATAAARAPAMQRQQGGPPCADGDGGHAAATYAAATPVHG